jgi:hypothetical protein
MKCEILNSLGIAIKKTFKLLATLLKKGEPISISKSLIMIWPPFPILKASMQENTKDLSFIYWFVILDCYFEVKMLQVK